MRRLTFNLLIALLTFSIGVSVWLVNPTRWIKSRPTESLTVTISPNKVAANSKVPFDHYLVTIENVSRRTVRGYSLGYTCNCLGFDDDGNPYPNGINFGIPNPEWQVLRPGESQTVPLPIDALPANEAERKVWADLVHFKGRKKNWGPNQSRRDGYVME